MPIIECPVCQAKIKTETGEARFAADSKAADITYLQRRISELEKQNAELILEKKSEIKDEDDEDFG
jgi:hypothetical protein